MKRKLILALVLISLFLFWNSFEPTLTPRLEVGRGQSLEIAQSFLSQRGLKTEGYHHSAVFEHGQRTLHFLERTVGKEALEGLLDHPVRPFWWEHRWFIDGQIEEYKVAVALDGRVIFFWRRLSEQASGENLEREKAREIALDFLRSQGLDPERLTALDASSEAHANRTDHTFTWRLTDFDVAQSQFRYDVWIQGDQVGLYREYLDRPESWDREYRELRARNLAANRVASTFGSLLECLVVLAFMAHLVKGDTSLKELNLPEGSWKQWMWSWKKSWGMSWQLFRQSHLGRVFYLTVVVVALGQINELPIALHEHDTARPFSESVLRACMFGWVSVVFTALWFILLVWCCGVLTRQVFPRRTPYQRLFSFAALRTPGVMEGVALGLVLLGVHGLTFQAFYGVAERLGAWSPLSVAYGGLLTGYLPWASALNVGFVAALGEELVYRVFAISWLRRLGASKAVAISIPAALWGFQHCFYAQQPFFIRGLELTLIGLIYGAVYLRWGVIPCLVSHFSWNAYATSSVLMKSSEPYLILSGMACAGVALWALMLGGYLRNRYGFLPEEPHWSPDPPAPPPPLEPAQTPGRLSRMSLGLAALALVCTVGYHWSTPPVEPINVSGEEAIHTAREELRARQHSFESTRVKVRLYDSWGTTGQYLWERGGPESLSRVFPTYLTNALWEVRFFQPGEIEEYYVRISASSGKVVYLSHELAEDASGANLSEEEAELRARALLELRQQRPAGELQGSESARRENRTDYDFTFYGPSSEELNLGEARLLESVTVRGDEAQRCFPYLDLPEQWMRQQNWTNWWEHLGKFLVGISLGGIACYGVVLGFKQVVGSNAQLSKLGKAAALLLTCAVMASVNQLRFWWVDYRTEQHPWSYLASKTSGEIEEWIMLLGGLAFLWIGAAALSPRWFVPSPAQRRAALSLAWVAVLIRLGLESLRYLLSAHFHPWLGLNLPSLPQVVLFSPALGSLFQAFLVALFLTLLMGCLAGVLRGCPTKWLGLAGMGFALGLVLESADQLQAIGPRALFHWGGLLLAVWLWKSLLKANAWAWFHFFFLFAALEDALVYLSHPALRLDGVLVLTALILGSIGWHIRFSRVSPES